MTRRRGMSGNSPAGKGSTPQTAPGYSMQNVLPHVSGFESG